MSTNFSDKARDNPLFATFPVAIFIHGVLLLGTGFMMPEPSPVRKGTLLDITLVNTQSEEAPKEADFIAESNQQGSGTLDEKKRISSASASDAPSLTNGDKTFRSEESAPEVLPKPKPKVLTTKGKTDKVIKKDVQDEEVKEPKVVRNDVSEKAEEIATLMAEMNREEQKYARRPRIHFVDSISAKSAVEARYIQNWAKKLERIGNINFPEEAIRLSLSGTLILNATLDRAGRVVEMQIDVSSGSRILDKAALRIVKLAAPYEPLPSEIRKKYDRLNITRSIVFHKENGKATFYTN
ncbi:MAG: energy transducer TonB [Proteobacteria bacterium]|nr:MAG: energy transducer TonB [Pseudomonadota bacterium]